MKKRTQCEWVRVAPNLCLILLAFGQLSGAGENFGKFKPGDIAHFTREAGREFGFYGFAKVEEVTVIDLCGPKKHESSEICVLETVTVKQDEETFPINADWLE
ncbi:MAG: hypothetical protein WC878_07525 [Candidatus Paceibacterota bacterium]